MGDLNPLKKLRPTVISPRGFSRSEISCGVHYGKADEKNALAKERQRNILLG
jgi:hypothetical protein